MSQSLLPPTSESATVGTGGSLAAGTYYYGVTALTPTGETKVSPVHAYTVAGRRQGDAQLGRSGRRHGLPDLPRAGLRASHSLWQHCPTSRLSLRIRAASGRTLEAARRPRSRRPPPTRRRRRASGTPRGADGSSTCRWIPGYYRNIPDGAGGYSEQAGWGVTASSLPVVGGLITLADLAAGQINHAIAIMVPQAAKSVFTFPAQRTDGVSTAANAIPEGARFRLPASLNLAAINMPPVTRMIAQAAQTYGLIVNDQTGATVGFRAEDPTPLMRQGQPNPYTTYFKTSPPAPTRTPTSCWPRSRGRTWSWCSRLNSTPATEISPGVAESSARKAGDWAPAADRMRPCSQRRSLDALYRGRRPECLAKVAHIRHPCPLFGGTETMPRPRRRSRGRDTTGVCGSSSRPSGIPGPSGPDTAVSAGSRRVPLLNCTTRSS